MKNRSDKLSKDVQVVNELGLHARSAAKIAEIAKEAVADIWVQRNDDRANARSIMDILTLACEKDSTITIVVEKRTDIHILDRIVELVQNGFGE